MSDRNDQIELATLVVGVTGHRKLREAEIPALQAQVRDFLLELQRRYPELPVVLLSSLAEGGDQLAAQVALDLGLRVIAPLPLPVELYRDDFDDASRAVFERQLQQVEMLVLPLRHDSHHDAIAQHGLPRDQQYAQAGIFISSHCHILLALWDGRDSEKLGGTAQIVRFHLQGSVPGQIDRRRRVALARLGLDEDTLVYHLQANREDAAEGVCVPGRWLTADEDIVAHDLLPPAFDLMFRHQAEFNADVLRYSAAILADFELESARDPDPGPCPIESLFVATDWMARTYQRRVGHVLRIVYLLAAAMGFAFFTYTHISAHAVVINLFLVFFLAGMGVVMLARRREWQRKHLDYRALAEGLRVQSYWRRAGIVDLNSPAFAHDSFLQKQDVELGWIRNVMRGASLDGLRIPAQAGPSQVEAVIRDWIGTPDSGGQLRYFSTTSARRARLHHRAKMLGLACLWAGIGISVLLAIFARRLGTHEQHVLVSTMGILSVAAAVHEAYAYKKADKELIKQYRFMQRIFGAARRRLSGCSDLAEKRQVLRTLGEAALAEHAEWTLMHRERQLEHSRL
ncbi:hypothetical protein J2X06_001951 [Lysobacter niastensis]|uniref:SMODS and SLOG-associating 2TM effector domain-containing protein n=1 Tax=Lysobacter niastensis TaxID=380629 RepID=A0ABU1WAU2_9GAMM|nr:hypothetical protein [Lysobacter niastensis]MDR7134742.1 hypothetical protein [Lysobacter niastensis]